MVCFLSVTISFSTLMISPSRGQVTLCRNSSCCLGVRSSSRGVWPSALWPTSSQGYTHFLSVPLYLHCMFSLTLFYPVGMCWKIPVSSERQRDVHSARRRPALPAPLCIGRQRGGSDVCGGARTENSSCVCRRWSKTTWCLTARPKTISPFHWQTDST